MPTSSTFTAEASASLPGPPWLRDARRSAMERFSALDALPTEAEEIWRYSRISELDLDAFRPATAGGPEAREGSAAELPADVQRVIDAIGERAALIVTRNGQVIVDERDGRAVSGEAPVEDLLGSVAGQSDAFTTLNAAFNVEPIAVSVPNGRAEARPVVIVHWIDEDGAAVFPRTVVSVGQAAELTVVEIVASPDIAAFVAPVTELAVADTGILRYVTVQELGPRVWETAYQASTVGQEGTLLSATVALGGDYARQRTDSRLVGAGATGNLLAVYFGERGQMHDFRTLQDHRAPKSMSDLLFKGAVAGTAHSVYSGLIRVEKGASGTNAFQTNRNLVLSEGARADSVPNLEIEENELRCSHASAVGPVDEEQRYYLESRGVPTAVANRLIVLGFLAEVAERVPVPGLRPYLREALAAKLDRSDTNLLPGGTT